MKIIGHRGVAGDYPENTKVSIEAAAKLGVEWVEVDVQPTKDNILVICHDHTIDRCSNGSGRIDEKTLEELRQFNFAARFGDRTYTQPIMTLSELLSLASDLNLKLNLELKVDQHDKTHVAQLLKHDLQSSQLSCQSILLSSFDHDTLLELHVVLPNYQIAVLTEKLSPKDTQLLQTISAFGCNLNYKFATKREVSLLQKQGFQVWCYTVNQPSDIQHLGYLDGIFSDFPARFLEQ
ncbi:glycerophosphodiester phosphodiesterase family protein [Vibrio hepatarius]|uniref:glycerophosphodiester phosphodiesterase family protein n=1 Tax=Vibrio hepatarius TaxID=171383 RepID=UPI001C09D814|nr:glycerophosphodiester phosphodiesterase family protein [Vibrio hepatarius]MBU2897385.1 glycerophosphoryl diester phosphodiesterase [Vibrio hepatarius]